MHKRNQDISNWAVDGRRRYYLAFGTQVLRSGGACCATETGSKEISIALVGCPVGYVLIPFGHTCCLALQEWSRDILVRTMSSLLEYSLMPQVVPVAPFAIFSVCLRSASPCSWQHALGGACCVRLSTEPNRTAPLSPLPLPRTLTHSLFLTRAHRAQRRLHQS